MRKYIDFIVGFKLLKIKLMMPLIRFYIKYFSGVKLGRGSKFHGMPIIVIRNGTVIIGDNFQGKSNVISNLVGLPHPFILSVREGGVLTIGNNVGISGASINCRIAIKIGNFVNIGGGAGIWDTDFHPVDPEERRNNPTSSAKKKPIVIEDDVFIGARAIILKGVTIGKASIVAAGTVVTKSVPPYSLAFGNPMQIRNL